MGQYVGQRKPTQWRTETQEVASVDAVAKANSTAFQLQHSNSLRFDVWFA